MAIFKIPTPNTVPARSQRVVLDGREFLFFFHWNELESKWYLDLSTSDGVALLSGIKLALGVDLLRRITDARRPAGHLLLVDMAESGVDPGLTDLGSRVQLMYVTA